MNIYNTLLVIVTVNCGEFIQGIRSEKIVTVNCGEFYNTLLVIVKLSCGEFQQHTLSKCDGELK